MTQEPLNTRLSRLVTANTGRLERAILDEVRRFVEDAAAEMPAEYGDRLLKKAGIERPAREWPS